MATAVWTGAVSGDINVGNNWLATTVPGAGDSWLLDERAARAMSANLSALSGTVFGSLTITQGYKLGIGGLGNALTTGGFTATGAIARIGAGAGNIYLASATNELRIQDTGTGRLIVNGGAHALVYAYGGSWVFAGGADLTALEQYGGQGELGYDATDVTSADIAGGSLISFRDIDTINLEGPSARLRMDGDAGSDTAATVRAGALLNWRARSTCVALTLRPGSIFTREGAIGDAVFTDTTVWPNSKRRFDVPGSIASYNGSGGTNASTFKGGLESSTSLNNLGIGGDA